MTAVIELEAPRPPGVYQLFVDVVEAGVAWFHERGSVPLRLSLESLAPATEVPVGSDGPTPVEV